MAPELVKEFVEEYQMRDEPGGARRDPQAAALRQDLVAIERQIAGIVRAIEDGAYTRP